MNLAPAAPVGLPAPASTGADFQVFVVVPKLTGSIERKPAASFSFGPRSPVAGEEVLFEDRSAGSPSSREWDFGDPSAGPSQDGPAKTSHVYAEPGTYTVRLTVSNAGGSSTRTREVTVASSPGSRRVILPVAGHVRGAAGSTYFTDLAVENPTGDAVSARIVFTSGDDPPLEAPLLLGPGESRVLADVVATQFGVDDAIGSIRVETDGAPPAPLRLACRTYLDAGGSTLGLGTVGLSSADETRGELYLSNLAMSEAFRTNVGAVSSSAEAQTFTVELRDGSGNILGRRNLSLPPGAQKQWALSQLFPGVTGAGLTLRVVPLGANVAPLAYAAVTDNASGDPTYYAAQAPSPVQYVPGIAGISGFGGAVFRSETSIANGGRGAATVTLTFLEHDRNNNSGAPKSTFVLGPYETLHVEDALPALFGMTETYGALRIESDTSPGVTVFQRILTDAVATAGSVGQQIDALSAENLHARGTLLGVRQNDAFRSNIGLLNPNAAAVPVVLVLVRSPATDIGSATVHVPPQSYVQRNLVALFPTAGLAEDEVLSIRVDGGSHSVFAFASVIDNASQDPTYYPELH
jgi:PKD repeat protein